MLHLLMQIRSFFDEATSTLSYLVWDVQSLDAVAIDAVLDYNPLASTTSTTSVDAISEAVEKHNLRLHYALETHAHADHLSGAQILKRRHNAKVAIGERITLIQKTFKNLLDLEDGMAVDGSQFDRLLGDREQISAGTLRFEVLFTPGHTPACTSLLFAGPNEGKAGAVFTGDALFMHDYGTGRCDFPEGNADDLYTSVHDTLYSLPDSTRVFVGHDYQPEGRPLRYETTIGKSKASNTQLAATTSREAFVRMRQERDATLQAPRLLYPSILVNIRAGLLPPPSERNATRYLKIPLNLRSPTDDAGFPLDG